MYELQEIGSQDASSELSFERSQRWPQQPASPRRPKRTYVLLTWSKLAEPVSAVRRHEGIELFAEVFAAEAGGGAGDEKHNEGRVLRHLPPRREASRGEEARELQQRRVNVAQLRGAEDPHGAEEALGLRGAVRRRVA